MTDELTRLKWRCFHCDEVFTTVEAARAHFGDSELEEPGCKLNALEGGLLDLYRKAQDELHSYRIEDSATSREFYALGAKHQTALRDAEQSGYDKGLADGRAIKTKSRPTFRQDGSRCGA